MSTEHALQAFASAALCVASVLDDNPETQLVDSTGGKRDTTLGTVLLLLLHMIKNKKNESLQQMRCNY